MMGVQPTEYQRQIVLLSENVRRVVMDTYRSMVAAGLSIAAVESVLVPIIRRGNIEAEALAVSELARMLERMGVPLEAASLTMIRDPDQDHATLTKALQTIWDGPDAEVDRRLERMALSEPRDTAQYTMSQQMRRSPNVAGWRRVVEYDGCELCDWLYRDGFIYPPSRPMTTHPGCVCTAAPVTPADMIREADRRYGHDEYLSRRTNRDRERKRREWIERAETAADGGDPRWADPLRQSGQRWAD